MSQLDAALKVIQLLQSKGFKIDGNPDLTRKYRKSGAELRVAMSYPKTSLSCTVGGVSTVLFKLEESKVKPFFQVATWNVQLISQQIDYVLARLKAEQFLEALDREENPRKQLRDIFTQIDELCHTGKFDEVDQILGLVDPAKYDLSVALGFLSISLVPMKEGRLRNYKQYFDKLKAHIFLTESDSSRRERLLMGLNP
jgi:hypothetical protein